LTHVIIFCDNIAWDNLKNVGEVYQEEISRAHVPLVKHFKFVLGTKPNHSQSIGSVSMTKRSVERQFIQSQMEDAQKRANDLELEV